MANRKLGSKGAVRFNDVQFVNYELSKEEKTTLKALVADGLDTWDLLHKLVEAGYRVSFKFDKYSDSPACFIQPIEDDHDNANRVLSGRGRTAERAACEVLFKHFHVFKEVWPNRQDKTSFETWDD